MVKCLVALEFGGWTLVYTEGSAKRVKGWWQAGYGAWFGEGSARNLGTVVPLAEQQSVSRGELQGVLYMPCSRGGGGVIYALQQRRAGERMVVVLDSEYVYKGITVWSAKWRHRSWRVKMKEIGHRDLWEQIWDLRQQAGSQVQVIWTPAHLSVQGNAKADELAEQGWLHHRHNKKRRSEDS